MHTNGSEIDVGNYIETIPFFVCQTHFTSCVTANPDAYNQVLCREQYACGTQTASASTTPTKSRTVLPRPTATGPTTSIPSGTSSEPDEVKVASSMATAIVKSNKLEIVALGICGGIIMILIGGSVTLSIPVIQLGSLLVGVPSLRY